jgi:hypothetical protein
MLVLRAKVIRPTHLLPRSIAFIAILSVIVLALGGCPKPVHLDQFLEDDSVIDVIQNSKVGKLFAEVDFTVIDMLPELVVDNQNSLTEGEILPLHYNDQAEIRVANAGKYKEIQWYCIGETPLLDGVVSTDGTQLKTQLNANPPSAPFTNAIQYRVTVVGFAKEDDKAYGTSFDISVE